MMRWFRCFLDEMKCIGCVCVRIWDGMEVEHQNNSGSILFL